MTTHLQVSSADHWILSLDPAPSFACTHLVREPSPHVTVSVVPVGAPEVPRSGRAVVFPGSSGLTGQLTVAELIDRTAIDRVEVLGSGVASPDSVVDTLDFVRPEFRGDDLVLMTMPAVGGVLVPFETREPTPCCADHG